MSSFVINRIRSFDDKKSAYDYETRFLKKVDAANNECFINLHSNNITLGEENEDGEFLLYASLGGKVQGKRNAESGHLNEILKQYWENVKLGKIERKRKIWCNNGVEEKQIDVDSHIPHSFVKGRLKNET